MKIKKVILFIFIIQLFSYIFLYAEEKIPKDKPGTAVFVMTLNQDQIIKVTSEIIKEESKGLELDMKIPIIHNLNNKIFQRRLNNKIKKEQLCLKSSIEKDAFRDHQYAKKKGFPIFPYTLMTNYNIKSNNEIFSLEISIYDYRGGAHGLTTRQYYNIDTKSSKILELQDLFEKGSNYEERLNKEIKKQIDERKLQGEIFFEDKDGFVGISKDQSFYIDKDGYLIIVFGLYEIAPYSSGIIEFKIPKEIFQIGESL